MDTEAVPSLDELAQKVADANAELQRRSDLLNEAQLAYNDAEIRAEQCGASLRNAIRQLIDSKVARP